jgi:hypothetical protein
VRFSKYTGTFSIILQVPLIANTTSRLSLQRYKDTFDIPRPALTLLAA